MPQYFIVYKPFGMLSQFTSELGHSTLAELGGLPSDVYPVGRLDADSEGLLLLTNDKSLNHLLLSPKRKHTRTYLVQVEGVATDEHARRLEAGVEISVDSKKYRTVPCRAKPVPAPANLFERKPPIRFRKTVPDSWLEITLYEGKNRQVRKMAAAVGLPALRLIRTGIESLTIEGLQPGKAVEIPRQQILASLRIHGGK